MKSLSKTKVLFLTGALTLNLVLAQYGMSSPVNALGNYPELISQTTQGLPLNGEIQGGCGYSSSLDISDDGRFVLFCMNGEELDPSGNSYTAVYVRDRISNTTTLASVNNAGEQTNGQIVAAGLSGDGNKVMFSSTATNIDPRVTTPKWEIYIRDLANGTTSLVSVNSNNEPLESLAGSVATFSKDGRYVAYSTETYHQTAPHWRYPLFLLDTMTLQSEEISENTSTIASVSYDARYISYSDINAQALQIKRLDRQTGETVYVSSNDTGELGNGNSGSLGKAMSADGRYILFSTGSTNFFPQTEDCPRFSCFVVKDLSSGTTELVNVALSGNIYAGNVESISMSADGSSIVFSALVASPSDISGPLDYLTNDPVGSEGEFTYVRNLENDTTRLVSKDFSSGQLPLSSYSGILNGSATEVIFYAFNMPYLGSNQTGYFANPTGKSDTSNDTTPPEIAQIAWTNNPKALNTQASVTVNVSDSQSPVDRIEYFIGDNDPGVGNSESMSINNQSGLLDVTASAEFDTSLASGVYKITIRALDSAGNWSLASVDYLVVYNPSGNNFTGRSNFVPSLAAGDVLPGLNSDSQTDEAKYGLTAKYTASGAFTNNSGFQFSYSTGENCKKPAQAVNCHDLTLDSTSLSWYLNDGTNDSRGTLQGLADLVIDGVAQAVKFRVSGVDGDRLTPASLDSFKLEIFNENDNPQTAQPLYKVDVNSLNNRSIKIS